MNMSFKKNDLYIYDLSEPVLNSLRLMVFDSTLREVQNPLEETEIPKKVEKRYNNTNRLQCRVCSLKDENTGREHFKSNFHTFNLKRTLKGLCPISQVEFEEILQKAKTPVGISSSDLESDELESDEFMSDESAFDESTGEKEENDENEILEQTIAKEPCFQQDIKEERPYSHLATRSSQIYFRSMLLPEFQVLGVYKSLFDDQGIKTPLHELRIWNEVDDETSSISGLFMIGGGHFAGAIVSHQRIHAEGNSKKQDQSLQEQMTNFIEHKTLHRYTTRRKQGGSQSVMDNAKGKANSAGSSLRRYNEAALRCDILQVLKDWEPYLVKCTNIFLRARNHQDKKMFTEIVSRGNGSRNLKSFPFTTGRPSVRELKRSWCELAYLKIVPKPTALPIHEVHKSVSTKPSQREKSDPSKQLSPEEKHTEQLLTLLNKGRAPLIVTYLRNNGLDVNFNLVPETQHYSTPTLLHYASSQGLKQMVTILLTNLKANPCLKNRFGKTPWDLSKNPQTRYSFQIARHILGENFTNWKEAHVKEGLSREQVEDMNKKEEESDMDQMANIIKKELHIAKERQKLDEEKKRLKKYAKRGTGRMLDSSAINRAQNLDSLSDEQRRRLMREQRARAAEARMRK